MVTRNENSIRSWFDQLYTARQNRSMRPPEAYLTFLKYLPLQNDMKLLDIGCGTGWLLKAAAEKGLSTWGIDLSAAAVELSRKNSPSSVIELAAVTKIPFPDHTFDLVTCIGVMEHFTELEQSISEIKRVTKKDTVFCIMVPNSRTLYWKIWQKFSKEHRESNENALSLQEWQALFQRYGFKIQEINRDDWRLQKIVSLIGINSNSRLYQIVKKFMGKVIPLSHAQQFIFILKIESQ
jgi:ubiquinone/menaquinone biosynthesis C-methylase UbiE